MFSLFLFYILEIRCCSVFCLYFLYLLFIFSYIVDYYIYKASKEFEKEGKILVILCENRIFLSIFAEYRGTC